MTLSEEIATIRDQEERLRFSTFSNDEAIDLGLTLLELARGRNLAVTIDVRRGGQQLFHAALAGTAPDNDEWVRRKSNVVLQLHKASLRAGLELEASGTPRAEREGLPLADYATHGGSFPIHVVGVGVVGAVTVSGLPQRDDHALVVEAIERVLGHT